MIYLSGLDSIIECEYLSEELNSRNACCNIFVNPDNVKYIIGKTIIINSVEYDYNKYVPTLLDNNCKIISRIKLDGYTDDIEFQPYILKICSDIQWDGKVIKAEEISSLNGFLDEDLCDLVTSDNYKLFFPKMDANEINKRIKIQDKEGNLTCLGWILQQVGVNIKKDTQFTNLDILKSGKVIFE